MRRRRFISLIGSAAAWPLAARAQQPGMPVVGFLYAASGLASETRLAFFRQGLADTGYVEGQNVTLLKMGADGKLDRLPLLAADLVRRQVNVIVTPQSSVAATAAHNATRTIPIIFSVTVNPVILGLVASLARPGGNATGVNSFSTELAGKRLGLLRELLPGSKTVAVLLNPGTPATQSALQEVHTSAATLGLRVRVVNAGTSGEIESAFAMLAGERPDALLVINDPLFTSRNTQIVLLAARHAISAIFSQREYADVGGLMSYGPSTADAYRQLGSYTGQVLKGTKPAELPVVQASKFEFVINLQAAKALGLEIPPQLLARADEVIE